MKWVMVNRRKGHGFRKKEAQKIMVVLIEMVVDVEWARADLQVRV